MSRESNDPQQTLEQHLSHFRDGTARPRRFPAERRKPTEEQNAAAGLLRRLETRKGQEQTEFASHRLDRFATSGGARLVYFSL